MQQHTFYQYRDVQIIWCLVNTQLLHLFSLVVQFHKYYTSWSMQTHILFHIYTQRCETTKFDHKLSQFHFGKPPWHTCGDNNKCETGMRSGRELLSNAQLCLWWLSETLHISFAPYFYLALIHHLLSGPIKYMLLHVLILVWCAVLFSTMQLSKIGVKICCKIKPFANASFHLFPYFEWF